MMDSTFGAISAPPMPWASRAATSTAAVGASPHSAEASANSARPMQKTRLRPYLSPRRPAAISSTAKVRPYPATTHSIALALACSLV